MSKKMGRDTDMGKLRDFLGDLEDVALSHGLVIKGCGCCGSPRIEIVEAGDAGKGYVADWNNPEKCWSLHFV